MEQDRQLPYKTQGALMTTYDQSAAVYDSLYNFKDYAKESELLRAFIQQQNIADGATILDVGCGTGVHLSYLKAWYQVSGMDLSESMLAVARQRHPDITFVRGDMVDFTFPQQFDAVICLFSAIGYVQTEEYLYQTLTTFARHTVPGGVVIVEPWFSREEFTDGFVSARFVDQPDLKIARMIQSQIQGTLSILPMHHLVATPAGITHYVEEHVLGLFDRAVYEQAFYRAGLAVTYDAYGLEGRGLYIGKRNS
jgi:ubiquinone/menaquinone biosynthesis C-methylase UbiE